MSDEPELARVCSASLKPRPHCLHVAFYIVEGDMYPCIGDMYLYRSTCRLLHVDSVSTLRRHVERFCDKKSVLATCRKTLNMFNFWRHVERFRYNVAAVWTKCRQCRTFINIHQNSCQLPACSLQPTSNGIPSLALHASCTFFDQIHGCP